MAQSFGSEGTLKVGDRTFTIHRLSALQKQFPQIESLPFCIKILLENLLRTENGHTVRREHIEEVANWRANAEPSFEIAFTPSRVLLQDFTGVPAIVDLAAMRDAMKKMGGDATKINPLQPVELVIDHSVQVDEFGTKDAFKTNSDLEFERNHERYLFLRWGQKAFNNFRVVPPETGIVHQVNLEYLARLVFTNDDAKPHPLAYPDTLVGTDSHTTMINGLGVLGWGVGGIEAEAAMLGQPVSMLLPQVVGVRLTGSLPDGSTATDLVLEVTQLLRRKGVVGKFVEFFGSGVTALPVADRATLANMAPEYGATCGIFPVDDETLRYMRLTGRPDSLVELVEAYYKEQGLFHTPDSKESTYSDILELDLATVEPSLAGPTRPQDRVRLGDVKKSFQDSLQTLQHQSAPKVAHADVKRLTEEGGAMASVGAQSSVDDKTHIPLGIHKSLEHAAEKHLENGSVVIAAITSCTNTSNPSVMLAAGLLAKKAVARGLTTKPWVKTSLAPGSKVVTEYLKTAEVLESLEKLRFFLVGYGCTTCIGNSGPLPAPISKAINDQELVVAAVLSGNRNFEGRIHPDVRANYLASPPLVVAYALAGRMDIDMKHEPLGEDPEGRPVFLHDIWPSSAEIQEAMERSVQPKAFKHIYSEVFKGHSAWNKLEIPEGDLFGWQSDSTYVKHPPYFENMSATPDKVRPIHGARVLAMLGDSVTTDHISPAGSIKETGPAGMYLQEHGVKPSEFNSYGSRRGNHEVMVRGTFANIRLRNQLAPGTEGGVTRYLPNGDVMPIFDAAMRYEKLNIPLIILAGKEYGSGSSRDWAAKGPRLLGIRAVIAESYERIHRSNLVGMGVLPLQFGAGDSAKTLGLTGEELYDIDGVAEALSSKFSNGRDTVAHARRPDGVVHSFQVTIRIDTPQEIQYYQHGGILPYALRQLLAQKN